MILDHPHQLAIALPLAAYWRRGLIVNLLISPHPYWKVVHLDDYASQFDQIVRFRDRPDYNSSLRGAVRQIHEILCIKEQVRHLGINQDDVIMGLSHCQYIENVVLSCTPKNLRIMMAPESEYVGATMGPDWSTYRLTRGGCFARYLVEPLTGLERTWQLTRRRQLPNAYGGSGTYRFQREVTDIYDKVVRLVSLYEEFGADSRTVSLPYPYFLTHAAEDQPIGNQRKRVVFFGTEFAQGGTQPTSSREFAKAMNECLSFLRGRYAETHRLIYRPHPHETEADWNLLDLSQFEIETDRQLAELYMAEHRDSIDAVFSVHSTCSRSAVNYGINAHVFFELFGFDDLTNRFDHMQLGRQPDGFFIKDLNTTPIRYQNRQRIEYARRVLLESMDTMVNSGVIESRRMK
jgi:hypothetical protein